VRTLSDETLLAIGRMTVAVGELRVRDDLAQPPAE
jgi:hypothetical protein